MVFLDHVQNLKDRPDKLNSGRALLTLRDADKLQFR